MARPRPRRPWMYLVPYVLLACSLPFAASSFARLGVRRPNAATSLAASRAVRYDGWRCAGVCCQAPTQRTAAETSKKTTLRINNPPTSKRRGGGKGSGKNWRVVKLHRDAQAAIKAKAYDCLLYTSPSPRDS